LHLDEAIEVARGEPYERTLHRRLADGGAAQLVEGPHFRLDRIEGAPDAATMSRYGSEPLLVIPLDAAVRVCGDEVAPGQCGLAETLDDVEFAQGLSLLAQPV
jgi:mannose-6-phosphate isomerase